MQMEKVNVQIRVVCNEIFTLRAHIIAPNIQRVKNVINGYVKVNIRTDTKI